VEAHKSFLKRLPNKEAENGDLEANKAAIPYLYNMALQYPVTTALWGLCPVFWHQSVFQKYSKLRKVDVIELRTDQNVMLHNGNVNLTGHC